MDTGKFRGENWPAERAAAIARDGGVCRRCGRGGKRLAVHHMVAFRVFPSADEANRLDNLVTLCAPCHAAVEAAGHRPGLWAGEPPPVDSFGGILRESRESREYERRVLARAAGVTVQYVKLLELGERRCPSAAVALAFARVLAVEGSDRRRLEAAFLLAGGHLEDGEAFGW